MIAHMQPFTDAAAELDAAADAIAASVTAMQTHVQTLCESVFSHVVAGLGGETARVHAVAEAVHGQRIRALHNADEEAESNAAYFKTLRAMSDAGWHAAPMDVALVAASATSMPLHALALVVAADIGVHVDAWVPGCVHFQFERALALDDTALHVTPLPGYPLSRVFNVIRIAPWRMHMLAASQEDVTLELPPTGVHPNPYLLGENATRTLLSGDVEITFLLHCEETYLTEERIHVAVLVRGRRIGILSAMRAQPSLTVKAMPGDMFYVYPHIVVPIASTVEIVE